jgi:hypothetical protein
VAKRIDRANGHLACTRGWPGRRYGHPARIAPLPEADTDAVAEPSLAGSPREAVRADRRTGQSLLAPRIDRPIRLGWNSQLSVRVAIETRSLTVTCCRLGHLDHLAARPRHSLPRTCSSSINCAIGSSLLYAVNVWHRSEAAVENGGTFRRAVAAGPSCVEPVIGAFGDAR